jgi:hypothetical protein
MILFFVRQVVNLRRIVNLPAGTQTELRGAPYCTRQADSQSAADCQSAPQRVKVIL